MTTQRGPTGRAFAELRRRRVFRTLALYILGAWGLMQVADVLLPALALPEEAIRYLLFAAIAGFPVALIFGWFFDITAEGVRRTAPASDAELDESQPLQPLKGLDYALLVGLLVVLGLIAYGLSDAVMDLPEQAAAPDERRAARDPNAPPMVGVLPFANLGAEGDGDFFASGVHDDLLTRLAKLGALRVVSRTSVLGYAGTTKRIPEIGRELRADAILEGGVRVAGELIRINAQLIDARSDEHLWAETYDRNLTAANIFEVQSDIARAIATAMQATLTPQDSAELALIPTENMAAYRAFHETMQWRDTVSLSSASGNRERYKDGLRRAIELDPSFTRPMVELVAELALRIFARSSRNKAEALEEIEALIARIAEVAPESADYYAAQSLYFYYVLRDFDRAEKLLVKAQEKAPSDARLVEIQGWINRRQGDFAGYLEAGRRARDLDPRSDKLNKTYIGRLATMHRYDAALRELAALEPTIDVGGELISLLGLREHHDPERYARDLYATFAPIEEYRLPWDLFKLWEAQLFARDFAGAQRTVDRIVDLITGGRPPSDGTPAKLMPNDLAVRMGQALATGDSRRAAGILAEIKQAMGLVGIMAADYPPDMHPMDAAQLAAVEGAREVAIDKANAYWRDNSLDRAEWFNRSGACSVLALVRAAEEATACLRNLFEEPSFSHPFLEPLGPWYDPIRDTAVFRALVAELVAEGWLEPGQAEPR